MPLAATVAAPSVFSGGANVIAVGVLLAEFGMFRQALLRDQVRLYAVQSGLISVLAILVAAVRHLPDLYVLAALSAALKVVIVPIVLRRLLRGIGRAGDDAGLGRATAADVAVDDDVRAFIAETGRRASSSLWKGPPIDEDGNGHHQGECRIGEQHIQHRGERDTNGRQQQGRKRDSAPA